MSGIISNNLDKSGVIGGAIRNDSTIQAYCKISGNSPASGGFESSLNVASISYGSTSITINFIEAILDPVCMWSVYAWSTGSSYKLITSSSATGIVASLSTNYRIQNNSGSQAVTTNGAIGGALIMIYGKPA